MTGDKFDFVVSIYAPSNKHGWTSYSPSWCMVQLVDANSACLEGFGREARNVRHAMLNKFRGHGDDFDALLAVAKDMAASYNQILPEKDARSPRPLTADEQSCLQLLRQTDYQWYKDRVATRLPNTCIWCTNDQRYKDWVQIESGILLVSADPGCGKSVLAKYMVDVALPRTTTICYFFKDMDQNTTRQALCALLHQLL